MSTNRATQAADLCAFLDSYSQLVQSVHATIANQSGRGRTNDVLAEMSRKDLGRSLSLTFDVFGPAYAKEQAREILRRFRQLEEALEVVAQLAGSGITPLLELAVGKDLMVLRSSRSHLEAQLTEPAAPKPASAGPLARLQPLATRLDSPRVSTAPTPDGVEIALRWVCDDSIVASHSDSHPEEVVISHPAKRENRARLPLRTDIAAFLASEPVPAGEPPALYWGHLLLLHPTAAVVIETLRQPAIEGFFDLWSDVAMLLVCGSDEVRDAAAQAVWRLDDFGVEFVLNILANRGMIPSGILSEEAGAAVAVLRGQCPATRLAFGQAAIEARFGPSLAAPPPEVRFKERYQKNVDSVTVGTYEVYTAPSLAAARAYLAAYPITEEYFYVEIETPEGPIGKDRMGMY